MPCWELNPSLVHTAATTTPTIHVALLFRSSQEHGCCKHCTGCHLPTALGADPAATRLPLSTRRHSILRPPGRPATTKHTSPLRHLSLTKHIFDCLTEVDGDGQVQPAGRMLAF
eukprot:TRINITY_DN215_c0_g2_i7.p2 TRINITY_DN215_c0_g2~~TRINITY_DN215_c0_g2_i7.p2  ORF type:complete len:114 (+),score=2.75 TRINITY_DN215_c0_g2_i7:70-411(+)